MPEKNGKDHWVWITRLAIILVFTAGMTHEIRLTIVETWRKQAMHELFSIRDALEMKAELLSLIPNLDWLRSDIAEIKLTQRETLERIRVLEQKVGTLERKVGE
jgi:hypothetical protein